MDRAEERAGLEDVGEQALMRGLATAFPFVRLGLSRSSIGRRSDDRPHSSVGNSPCRGPTLTAARLMSNVSDHIKPPVVGAVSCVVQAPFRVLFKGRLPSRFLCSTWEPVSSSRPALLPGRRAQLPSRLAVGERRQRCPLSPGHALTVASTASGYGRSGRFRALLREPGPRD